MNITEILRNNADQFGLVTSIDYRNEPVAILDLVGSNQELANVDLSDPEDFWSYKKAKMTENNARVAIGRYMENRNIYDHSDVFSGKERRTVHLGIDINAKAGTEIICPYDGKVHSFQNNIGKGDYGPTIILEHNMEGMTFYTLYGHLSEGSLNDLHEGQEIKKGEHFAYIGNYPINGDRPPHVHFQIITDMQDKKGDFPGVCSVSRQKEFAALCPDPNLILQISKL